MKEGRARMRKRVIIATYLALLLASSLVRGFGSEPPVSPASRVVDVPEFAAGAPSGAAVRLAYRTFDDRPDADPRPVVVLLHGSPGRAADFRALAPHLSPEFRLIAPDLPGFGDSSRAVADYSLAAHAQYVLALLDRRGIERAHFGGFSMGGGVALNVAALAPERVRSLTMLAAVGVQEMELLGDYHLNHALHGLQLAGLWLVREATPHFGYFDGAMLGVEYARNFFDSDQRPLREALQRFAPPMLILHGRRDMLVPVEAALEHQRLVPQSALQVFEDENHFPVFLNPGLLAGPLTQFIRAAEAGTAATRPAADATRVAQASEPFNPASLPKASGITALVLVVLIAAATLVSEDLTCIGAGVMAAQGRVDLTAAILGCFLGIFVGDVLLYLAGRFLGRPALRRAPLKWLIRAKDVERGSQWLERNGLSVIATSRFIPGMRLPTYFAAGLLNTKSRRFACYFLLACAVWTPLLVGLSFVLGEGLLKSAVFSAIVGQGGIVKVLVIGLFIYVTAKLSVSLATYRGRRLLVSWWQRKRHWEFWSPFFFYPPVVCYIAWLALQHRGLTVFTAANPAIPGGGFVGESKADILQRLSSSDTRDFIARYEMISGALTGDEKLERALRLMREPPFGFPVVLKPDLGQRGSGVAIVRSEAELRDYLLLAAGDTIMQEYAPGEEFGVFYYRYPDWKKGRIFAITEKRFPVVTGDGESQLERLILQDRRAVCMAKFYLDHQQRHLADIPAAGEPRQLVEVGTHSRGSVFLDGGWVWTEALEEAIDRVSKGFDGFYFGRYDIRTPSIDEFKAGRNFKVVELNGVTSEATSIYDPKNSLFAAYRTLFAQWRLAFEIGARNRRRGVKPTPLRQLLKLIVESYNVKQ